MENKNQNFSKGILCILITTFAFSTIELTGKMISQSINPFQMAFIRFFIGGLFLLPFALREMHQRKLAVGINDVLFWAMTGTIGIVISMSFFQTAVLYAKASLVAVIFSTNPIFTAVLACFILKEKLTIQKIAALLVSIIGVVFIFNPFSSNSDIRGILLSLIAAITFSLYTVISKIRISKYGSLILNSFSFLIGSFILMIIMLLTDKSIIAGIGPNNIIHLLYLGIFASGIGYLCYFTAMKHTSVITTSMVFFIKPALASILSYIILKEDIHFNTLVGIVCIIAASVIMFYQKKQPVKSLPQDITESK